MISRKIKPVAGWRFNHWRDGYDGTIYRSGSDYRAFLLLAAVKAARSATPMEKRFWHKGVPSYRGMPGLVLHCEGGYAFDRHARRLVKDGLVTVQRMASHQAYSQADGTIIRRSFLAPTAKGFAEADRLLNQRRG